MQPRTLSVTGALLGLGVALAGCTPAETPSIGTGTSPEPSIDLPSGGTDSPASDDSPYLDGSYTASGSYRAPSGNDETVSVELSLADGVITAITVTPGASHPTSRQYQTRFAGGIAAAVVGKSIDELSVDRVAGSSLTSGGFNRAIETIKADALG